MKRREEKEQNETKSISFLNSYFGIDLSCCVNFDRTEPNEEMLKKKWRKTKWTERSEEMKRNEQSEKWIEFIDSASPLWMRNERVQKRWHKKTKSTSRKLYNGSRADDGNNNFRRYWILRSHEKQKEEDKHSRFAVALVSHKKNRRREVIRSTTSLPSKIKIFLFILFFRVLSTLTRPTATIAREKEKASKIERAMAFVE